MGAARLTFPTAASPSKTSLTLLDGFGVVAVESAIAAVVRSYGSGILAKEERKPRELRVTTRGLAAADVGLSVGRRGTKPQKIFGAGNPQEPKEPGQRSDRYFCRPMLGMEAGRLCCTSFLGDFLFGRCQCPWCHSSNPLPNALSRLSSPCKVKMVLN